MKKIMTSLMSIAAMCMAAFGALVDIDGNPATNQTLLADIDMLLGSVGDLKDNIAPNYATVSNNAMNAVNNAMAAATNENTLVELISPYGIASSVSNELNQMHFTGKLLTNNFTIAYVNDEWQWTIFSGDGEDTIQTGTIDDFSPLDSKTTIALVGDAVSIYGTDNIVFQSTVTKQTISGIVRSKDLTTIIYDNETDWMALQFNKYGQRFFPNSNQVQKIARDARPKNVSELTNDMHFVDKSITNGLASKAEIPTSTSQLQNDSGFATTQHVESAVSNLNAKIEANTNFVRRTDSNFGLGSGNTLGIFSAVIGNNNTLGNRSMAFGFSNRLLSPSYGNAQQYAFGLGNRSQAPNNFIVGMGSGATEDGENSITLGTMSVSTNRGAFVWNWYPTDYASIEADQIYDLFPKYYSHGPGTYNINPIGGLKGFWIGETNFEQHVRTTVADPIAEAGEIAIDHMKQFVTNSTIVGYTEWRYTGNTSPTAVYSITMSESGGGNYAFTLNDTVAVTTLGTVITNTLNPTILVYTSAGITASRDPIRRNNNGFAYNSDVQKLRAQMTNEVHTLRKDVEDMDTSYIHYNQITNVNQSVQYIVPASGQTTLEIKIPKTGITKDWVIYVNTNEEQPLSLVLPPANYWVASEEVTNDIVTATALYFSQINADTFSLGRKEMIPVTVSSSRVTTFSVSPSAKKSAAARRLSRLRSKVDAKK